MSDGSPLPSPAGCASAHYHPSGLAGLYCSTLVDEGPPRACVHDRLVLFTLTAGQTLVWCRGEAHLLRPGSLLMIEPGDVHRDLQKTPYRAAMVVLRADLATALRKNGNGPSLGAVVARCSALCEQILALVETVRARRDLALQEEATAGLFRRLEAFRTQAAPRSEP